MDSIEILRASPLCDGLSDTQISGMLACLGAKEAKYAKYQTVLHAGDSAKALGLVLSGSVSVVRDDFWGNRNILTKVSSGQLFAETFSLLESEKLTVSVIADEATEIMWLNANRMLTPCANACVMHARMTRNLSLILAKKNLMLNEKLGHITRRSTRDKLLSYLAAQADKCGLPSFTIPYNRQQLADYLSVDRSALSSELGRMQKDGLIEFEKNRFTLLHND